MNIEEAIRKLLEKDFGLQAGDSGYDFARRIRDITFSNANGQGVEITIRELETENHVS